MKNTALGIIDVQRGFMPAEEGERLGLQGFGELPVPQGETVVPALNKLLMSEARIDYIFTTQDWHPEHTAHFAEEPNFDTTWPTHCVGNTPGAKIHPLLELPTQTKAFFKGYEVLEDGKDDTSYSGFNATELQGGEFAPRVLDRMPSVEKLILGGLATDYCVKATALDFATKTDMEIIVLSDAIMPVAEETGRLAVQEMRDAGVTFVTVNEATEMLREG